MTTTSKRGTIRNMLSNADQSYRLRTYAIRASKAIGREVTKGEVKSCLRNMFLEGKIEYFMAGQRVIGTDRFAPEVV